jgi:hypothetical protein
MLFATTGLSGIQINHVAPALGALLFAIPSLLTLNTLTRVGRIEANRRWALSLLVLLASLGVAGLLEMRPRTSDIPVLLVLLPFATLLTLPLLSSRGDPTARRDAWRRLARLTVQLPLAQALAVWVAVLASISIYVTSGDNAPFAWVPAAFGTYLSVSALGFTMLLTRPGSGGDNAAPPLERAERVVIGITMGICVLISSICLSSIYVEVLETGTLSQRPTTMSLLLTAIFGTIGLFIAEGSRGNRPELPGAASRWVARALDLIPIIYIPTMFLATPSLLLGYEPAHPERLDSTFIFLLMVAYAVGSMLHLGTRAWRGRAWIWSLPASLGIGLLVFGAFAAAL